MNDVSYDAFVYHDFSREGYYSVGDPAPELGGENYTVVATGPPVHDGKDATVVTAFGDRPMPEIRAPATRRQSPTLAP